MVFFFSFICLLTLEISFFYSEGTSVLEFPLVSYSCIDFFRMRGSFVFNAKIWKANESELMMDSVSEVTALLKRME